MKNFVLRYGLVGGCTLIVLGLLNWFFVAQTFGYTASEVVGYASMVVALLAVPLGITYFRDKLNQGIVSFKEALKIGGGITLITSVIMFLYSTLFFIVEGDNFKKWYENGLDVERLQQMQAQMEAMPAFALTPWFQGLVMLLTVLLIGVVITLISSLVLKRTKPVGA